MKGRKLLHKIDTRCSLRKMIVTQMLQCFTRILTQVAGIDRWMR